MYCHGAGITVSDIAHIFIVRSCLELFSIVFLHPFITIALQFTNPSEDAGESGTCGIDGCGGWKEAKEPLVPSDAWTFNPFGNQSHLYNLI